MIKKIYLIGGGPRTGKTTIAKLLAKKLECPYLSMDDIRNLSKAIKPRDASEDLYYEENLDVEEFYEKYKNPEEVLELEKKQNKAVEYIIEEIINNFYDWESVLIEGIGITPEFINSLYMKYPAKGLIVTTSNQNIENRIDMNGLWDNENPYPDKYKEKEKAWATMYNEWFVEEAKKHKIKVIENNTKILDIDTNLF